MASEGLLDGMSLWVAGRLLPPDRGPPIPERGMRAGSKEVGRERRGALKESGKGGGRSLAREIRQVLESTAFAQFKWPERNSKRRGQGWAAAAGQ